MPWQLNTAVQVGDLDESGPYAQLNITDLRYDGKRKQIRFGIEYGNTVGDDWVPGVAAPQSKETWFSISGAEYDALVSHVSNNDELTYAAVKRGLYEWLVANEHIGAGSVV